MVVYNITHEYKDDITDTKLKEIINRKLYIIILFLETCVNEAN